MATKERGRKERLCEISFRPAQGGAISETRTEYQRGGQGGGPDVDYDHETVIHPTMEHAERHLRKTLGPAFGDEEEEPEAPEE